jgi:hypothetical protein
LTSGNGEARAIGSQVNLKERLVRLESLIVPDLRRSAMESFNGRLRDGCLSANWFTNLSDARRKIVPE